MFAREAEIDHYCLRLGLPDTARNLIAQIRSSEPVRKVRGGKDNVIGLYPSRKMGRPLQFESHRCELPFIQAMDNDENIIEIWDQPATFNKFEYIANNGRRVVYNHVPDFFICHVDYAAFIECKLEKELPELAEKKSRLFCKGDNGEWRCPPGEEHVRPFGFRYIVHSTSKINMVYIRNLHFMDFYLRADPPETVSDEARESILSIVRSYPGISLAELLTHVISTEAVSNC